MNDKQHYLEVHYANVCSTVKALLETIENERIAHCFCNEDECLCGFHRNIIEDTWDRTLYHLHHITLIVKKQGLPEENIEDILRDFHIFGDYEEWKNEQAHPRI